MEPWGVSIFLGHFGKHGHEAVFCPGYVQGKYRLFCPIRSAIYDQFRVENLEALLEQLRTEGVTVLGEPMEEEFGKLPWIMDPEGNKIELWEQTK